MTRLQVGRGPTLRAIGDVSVSSREGGLDIRLDTERSWIPSRGPSRVASRPTLDRFEQAVLFAIGEASRERGEGVRSAITRRRQRDR